jgi:hypothetical protein
MFLIFGSYPAVLHGEPVVAPMKRAHAHNDYYHPRPLLDALDQGFCSIEADVFAVNGKLLIGHDQRELTDDRTFESLYLRPLAERVRAGGGRVFADAPPLLLLVDFKSDAAETYALLQPLLGQYESILVRDRDGVQRVGAVQVIISGNRPFDQIASDPNRLAYIDGRLSDLSKPETSNWMPLISDHWGSHFRWRGRGQLEEAERLRIRELLELAHQQGRRVRFWATPDHAEAWSGLYELGVDLINTDDLVGLGTFLRSVEEAREDE